MSQYYDYYDYYNEGLVDRGIIAAKDFIASASNSIHCKDVNVDYLCNDRDALAIVSNTLSNSLTMRSLKYTLKKDYNLDVGIFGISRVVAKFILDKLYVEDKVNNTVTYLSKDDLSNKRFIEDYYYKFTRDPATISYIASIAKSSGIAKER